ncbi:BMP family ABC transporter substrate-binding protein [Vallitalea okinawensis]|uniref:BMP family ABC transporter substrate-binding protein n=1 Tax=Vallitalea okinawensis TaxID=2078660 RepID=UPI000CFDD399|nr:BMP family ABC transporter substrate-binding protein [Vallitalea okinawensis]
MKKFICIILTLTLLVSLVGCNTTGQAEETTVGFIYVGPIGDGGWSYAHDQGRQYLEQELGVKTIYVESVPENQEVEQVIKDMVDQGASIIFATSFGYMNYVKDMATEYPEVTFFHCSGYESAENMANYFGRMYEPRYLSGKVAGLKTETNKIGYVAAFPIPEVIRGINAFTLGVQSVNPEAEVEVVWTSTWYDPASEKEAAVALLDNGSDVIAQHQDTAGPQQAAEERGAFSIGYNTDMSAMAPEAYMTAPVWNWGPYYVEQVKAVQEGTFESHAYWGGMNEGVVELAELTELAPTEAKDIITEATESIKDGSLTIFEGPLKDNSGELRVEEGVTLTDEELLGMNWFVEGVIGKVE